MLLLNRKQGTRPQGWGVQAKRGQITTLFVLSALSRQYAAAAKIVRKNHSNPLQQHRSQVKQMHLYSEIGVVGQTPLPTYPMHSVKLQLREEVPILERRGLPDGPLGLLPKS